MSSYLQLLKFSVIGLAALTGLAACHPTYVHESYQESYVPAYRPMPAYAPAYSAHYYSTVPTYAERRTVVVPRVFVTQPHMDRHHGWDSHDRNQHGGNRDGDFRDRNASHPNRVGIDPGHAQVHQQSRNVVSPAATSQSSERGHRREHGSYRKDQRGKDG